MKMSPSARVKETLQFVLDHPRRCYTLLFPKKQTLILLISVIGLLCVFSFPLVLPSKAK
jgi:Trk-type K+ transport system membrane component